MRKQRRQAEPDNEPLVEDEAGHLESHNQGRMTLLLLNLLVFLGLLWSLRRRRRLHTTIMVGGLGLGVSRSRAHNSHGQQRVLCSQQHDICFIVTFPKAEGGGKKTQGGENRRCAPDPRPMPMR